LEGFPHVRRFLLEKEVLVGGELRVAPSQNDQLAAGIWRFWTDGSDIYALKRSSRGLNKLSVHQSGQIHMRIEGKDLQLLASPQPFGDWLHAFELRFLISQDSLRPREENLKRKRAFLIDVPTDTVLYLNLWVGRAGLLAVPDLPLQPAAKPLWRATLSDQRPVVLTGRLLELDEQNRQYLKYLRQELNPKANFTGIPTNPYVEITHTFWDPKGGNVVIVTPLGKEGFRVHDSVSTQSVVPSDSRAIVISTPSVSTPISAPNREVVGTLSISGTTIEATLVKNVELRRSLGVVTLTMNPSNLLFGKPFFTPTYHLACGPTVGGGQAKNWGYQVKFVFDGATLKAELRKMSAALRNAALPVQIPGLSTSEEIVVRVPFDGLVLETTATTPQSSVTLEGGFLLRDT
jgi:hypothetical protein